MANVMNESMARPTVAQSLVSYTHVIYALHAASVLVGVFTAAGVLTSFLFSIPSIVAVIMNYARQSEVRGTWLQSHFTWQIRTFWWAAGIGLISFIVSAPLMLILIGFVLWWVLVTLTGVWVFYRVVRGWLRLREGREMYER